MTQTLTPGEWYTVIRNAECIAADNIYKCRGLTSREDIRQELLCAVIEALPRFNPQLSGIITFADRIMRRRIKNILIHYHTEKYRLINWKHHRRN